MSLETLIASSLCIVVLLGSLAIVETDRRITKAVRELPSNRRAISADPGSRSRPRQTRPRLVCLVSIGGLRADRLDRAPRLQSFGAEAVSFRVVAAQASHTLVSLKSMLTGKYPSSLILEETGADLDMLAEMSSPEEFMRDTFSGVKTTLASHLSSGGYRTAGFTDGGWASPEKGFEPGFDVFSSDSADLFESVDNMLSWLDQSRARGFAFLHTEALTAAHGDGADYDARLLEIDRAVGTLIDGLQSKNGWREALVVVTAEHGQSLGERGLSGSGDLYLEQLLVPLLVKFPTDAQRAATTTERIAGSSDAAAARRVEEAVELVDLLPTILAACEVTAPTDLDGTSLLPMLQRGIGGREYLVAQTSWGEAGANLLRRCVLAPDDWQVIHDAGSEQVEFFALSRDPAGLVRTSPDGMRVPDFLSVLLEEASVVDSRAP